LPLVGDRFASARAFTTLSFWQQSFLSIIYVSILPITLYRHVSGARATIHGQATATHLASGTAAALSRTSTSQLGLLWRGEERYCIQDHIASLGGPLWVAP